MSRADDAYGVPLLSVVECHNCSQPYAELQGALLYCDFHHQVLLFLLSYSYPTPLQIGFWYSKDVRVRVPSFAQMVLFDR